MASEYAACPICMEDYDLDIRIPKSLDCRHSLCKLCLMNKGQPLRSCPICRQPVNNPDNVPNDLTMIEYFNHKERKKRLKEQETLRKKLRDLADRVRVELVQTEKSQQDHNLVLGGREKLFRQYCKSLFETCLEQCSLKDALRHAGQ